MKSWQVSDELWARVEPVCLGGQLPGGTGGSGGSQEEDVRPYQIAWSLRGSSMCFEPGAEWKAIPPQYGSGSTLHLRFQQWERAGVWRRLWRAGLAEYDELEGIAWRWQSADASMGKAPLGGEANGAESDGPGEKRGSSGTCSPTVVVSLSPSS